MAENHLHHGKGIASTQRSSAWPSHATLSLSLFSLALSHTVPACWQPPWHRGQKSLFPNTANSAWLGARLPACLTPPTPTRGSLRQGYLAVGMGGVAWPSIYYYERRLHWGERREREKGRGERAGESEEEGRGVGGEWRLPPHTPSPQPFNQLFFFLITRSVWDTRGPGNEHMLRYGYTGWAARACVRVRHLENGAVHRI